MIWSPECKNKIQLSPLTVGKQQLEDVDIRKKMALVVTRELRGAGAELMVTAR